MVRIEKKKKNETVKFRKASALYIENLIKEIHDLTEKVRAFNEYEQQALLEDGIRCSPNPVYFTDDGSDDDSSDEDDECDSNHSGSVNSPGSPSPSGPDFDPFTDLCDVCLENLAMKDFNDTDLCDTCKNLKK